MSKKFTPKEMELIHAYGMGPQAWLSVAGITTVMTTRNMMTLHDWAIGSHPAVPDIIKRVGKRYEWIPVPPGLPRYRAIGDCHRNCQLAVMDDPRLRYVEGLALGSAGRWVGHAWVTLDGVHAIDLTWRGQPPHWTKRQKELQRASGTDGELGSIRMNPAVEYYGVEIPTKDLARIIVENQYHGLCLHQWMGRKTK